MTIKTAVYLMVKYRVREIRGMVLPLDPQFRNFDDGIERSRPPSGAEPAKPQQAEVKVFDLSGQLIEKDYRVRIRVPNNYLKESTKGNPGKTELADGIIFPYTPSISYDIKADYTAMNTVHSNYTQYFFNNSSVGQINISGKFTVQNDVDARVYLSTKHLLSALMKMPYGDDPGAGAPPPVCRLYAYGDHMLKDVPIVITSFRIEFPNDVDYYGYGKQTASTPTSASAADADGLEFVTVTAKKTNTMGENFVPVSSTFNITCVPVYSRREMLKFSLKEFIENHKYDTKYL